MTLDERLTEIYSKALKTAIEANKEALKRLKNLDKECSQRAAAGWEEDDIAKYKKSQMNRILRETQLCENIAERMDAAGLQAGAEIQREMAELYMANNTEVKQYFERYTGQHFAQINEEQLRVVMAEEQPVFSKIAYRNLGKNVVARNRLQSEMAQAVLLGESQAKVIKRIRDVAGYTYNWQARRVAQTEQTRVRSQARYDAAEEATAMGIHVVREWRCRFVNSRDSHMDLHGQMIEHDGVFHTINNNDLRFPGDPLAPAAEIINCHCLMYDHVLLPNEELRDGKIVKKGLDSAGNGSIIKSWEERYSERKIYKNSELPNGLPIKAESNSIADKTDDVGNVLQRRLYDDNGRASTDFDTSNHGMPKRHPTGAHKHFLNFGKNNPHSKPMPLTEEELEQNGDIIQEGVNYHANG